MRYFGLVKMAFELTHPVLYIIKAFLLRMIHYTVEFGYKVIGYKDTSVIRTVFQSPDSKSHFIVTSDIRTLRL